MDALGAIVVDLVDVLPEDHRRRPQRVGQARQRDVAIDAPRDHVVRAGDHERSPNEEHGDLAKPDVFQRVRVEEDEERAGREQRQRQRSPRGHEICADE